MNCVLKPYTNHKGFELYGFSCFTGATFSKDGTAFFGDVFELTIDLNQLSKQTNQIPVRGWDVSVQFPQLNNKWLEFKIESAPIDRTIGTCLLRCSALSEDGSGKRVNRNNLGGI